MKSKRIIIGLIIAVVVAGGIAAIAATRHNKTAGSTPSISATATNVVGIKDYMFNPATITVKPGTTVTWTNQDAVNHTITADKPTPDAPASMDIGQGKSYSFQFKVAGTYTYHCFPHPYMHGTVIVTN